VSDATLVAMWLGVVAASVAACVILHRAGLRATYIRDVIHVGAGAWVLGWPLWHAPLAPTLLAAAVAAGVALAPRLPATARLRASLAEGDERWSGLTRYGLAYAVLTGVGLSAARFPAAGALLALSLGDGVGGAVGRRFGRHRYTAPGGKQKSLEGSITVAVMAALGVVLAGARAPGLVASTAVVAAVAEALAPRATDNLIVPAAVWLWLCSTSWV
jgi:dolichol kinase